MALCVWREQLANNAVMRQGRTWAQNVAVINGLMARDADWEQLAIFVRMRLHIGRANYLQRADQSLVGRMAQCVWLAPHVINAAMKHELIWEPNAVAICGKMVQFVRTEQRAISARIQRVIGMQKDLQRVAQSLVLKMAPPVWLAQRAINVVTRHELIWAQSAAVISGLMVLFVHMAQRVIFVRIQPHFGTERHLRHAALSRVGVMALFVSRAYHADNVVTRQGRTWVQNAVAICGKTARDVDWEQRANIVKIQPLIGTEKQ